MMIQSDIPIDYPVDTVATTPIIPTANIDLLSMVNLPYILCTIITIYFIIKSIESNINKPISSYIKSAIVISIGILYAIIFNLKFHIDHSALLLSFVLSTFGYDLIIKPLLRKVGIHYKDYKTTDKPITKL